MKQKNKFEHSNIEDRETYISLFDQYDGNIKEVLSQILDIRKFEIQLYWTRTSFFWTIIGSIIAGYFLVFAIPEKNVNLNKILFCLSNLGLTFSVGWYFANRGSKYWQVNWEKHLDTIEDDIIGPLYKTTISRSHYRTTKQFFKLLSPYPFSVSKINQVLNIVVIGFWLIIILDFATSKLSFNLTDLKNYYSVYTLVGTGTLASIISLVLFTQTEISNAARTNSQSKETKINFEKRGLK